MMFCAVCHATILEYFGGLACCASCFERLKVYNPVLQSMNISKNKTTNIIEITGDKIGGGEGFEVHVHPEFPCRPIEIDVDHAEYWRIHDCRVGNELHVLKPMHGIIFQRYFGNSIKISTITPATRLTIKGTNLGKKAHKFHAIMTVVL